MCMHISECAHLWKDLVTEENILFMPKNVRRSILPQQGFTKSEV